jgi:hypothetical protein
MKQTIQTLLPIALICAAVAIPFERLFQSQLITLVAPIGLVFFGLLIWRYWIFQTLSDDYAAKFESASQAQHITASKWTAMIFVGTYAATIAAFVIVYFGQDNWREFALIVLLVGRMPLAPWSLIATDWVLHRTAA